MKIFTYGIIGIVVIAIVVGFFIVGSPGDERIRRFDERRISDLGVIQSEIIYYWQSKEILPAVLDNLRDDLRGVSLPLDPDTSAPYEYKVLSDKSFELCAVFSLPSDEKTVESNTLVRPAPSFGGGFENSSWGHKAGQVCFLRTIDPDFFRPLGKN